MTAISTDGDEDGEEKEVFLRDLSPRGPANNTVIANAAGGMDEDQIATMTLRGINGHKGERVLSFKIAPLKATMMIIR